MSLFVRILTLNGVIWESNAEELILPSSTGLLGILPGHASLLASLDIGVVRIKANNDKIAIVVIEGFVEVKANEVLIVSNKAELGSLLNLEKALKDFARVNAFAESALTKKEKLEAAVEVRKSRARLDAVS
jgi:F-type H+-transporting ATPase subunit epsilon